MCTTLPKRKLRRLLSFVLFDVLVIQFGWTISWKILNCKLHQLFLFEVKNILILFRLSSNYCFMCLQFCLFTFLIIWGHFCTIFNLYYNNNKEPKNKQKLLVNAVTMVDVSMMELGEFWDKTSVNHFIDSAVNPFVKNCYT